MSEPLTCRACGTTGYAVTSRIVEVDDPQLVAVPASPQAVPERFRLEPRCLDTPSCEERQDAIREGATP